MDLGYNWTNNYLAPPPHPKKMSRFKLKMQKEIWIKKKLF